MTEIYPRLFIGNSADFENDVKSRSNWKVIHACKEYHRQRLGYKTKAAPRNPNYLYVEDRDELFLNLIDAPFQPPSIFKKSIQFIEASLADSYNVLAHCRRGESRAPAIGLLYIAMKKNLVNYESIKVEFKKVYPHYYPSPGIEDVVKWILKNQ